MEIKQDVHTVCCTCLSSDRDLFSLNGLNSLYQIFRLLIYDYTGDRYGESTMDVENLVCWECLALMKRFNRFKSQVQNAQEHLRILAMSQTQESVDHTYMSQSLSSLEASTKTEYDKIYLYYTQDEWPQSFIVDEDVKSEGFDVAQTVRENITLDIDDHLLEVPEMVLENPVTGVMSHIVVGTDALVSPAETYKGGLNVTSIDNPKIEILSHKKLKNDITNISDYVTDYVADREMILEMAVNNVEEKVELKYCFNADSTNKVATSDKTCGYITDYMTENELTAYREQLKEKIQYASSVYKCELCIIGFYTQQQVEDHFLSEHRAKPGQTACKVCYVYVENAALTRHTDAHYTRHTCKLCGHREYSAPLIAMHTRAHLRDRAPASLIRIGDAPKSKKKSEKSSTKPPPKSGDLRKLLSKTTIEGYRCLECDMFFKNSRARKNHVARIHREGLQCDHCKKRFVNRTTLATHLRLQHGGPLPREECPICHKMVRVIQLKYHVQRHENKKTFLCVDCNKTFSHLATYQAHLKYSRAHATESVFKYPCPMCQKGYPSKEAMQDHFNYQHLGKTSHKCSICDKPIASRVNVEKHMMRMHGQKKEKPKNHVCQTCGKGFTDKKALNQHEVIHSGERPLTCDICQQTFKQKASLYTHRKRVHKVYPPKRLLQYVEPTTQ